MHTYLVTLHVSPQQWSQSFLRFTETPWDAEASVQRDLPTLYRLADTVVVELL